MTRLTAGRRRSAGLALLGALAGLFGSGLDGEPRADAQRQTLPAAAQPLPSASREKVAERIEALVRQARELHSSALQYRKREAPERVNLMQRALVLLDRALSLDESDVELRVLLGVWLSRPELGEATLKRAPTELLRARAADTTGAFDCEISSQLGIVYSHLMRFNEAIAEYDRALRVLPGEPDLLRLPRRWQRAMLLGNSAEALMAKGQLSEAISRYAEAESLDSSDQSALYALGLAVSYDRDGQVQKSREALQRSLAADPGLRLFQSEEVFFVPEGDRAYYEGLINEGLGKRDDALRLFQEFVQELPSSRYVKQARAHIDELKKQPGLSFQELARAVVLMGPPTFPPPSGDQNTARLHRSETDIQKVTQMRSFELRQCYAKALKRVPKLRGSLLLALALDKFGAVEFVQVLENRISEISAYGDDDATVADPRVATVSNELLRCISGTVHRWRFSPAEPNMIDRDELALPIRFEPM